MTDRTWFAVIPASVRYSSISPSAKLLFGEISVLTKQEGFCWASNAYLGEPYGASADSVSRWVKELEEAGFISVSVLRGDKGTVRQIRLEGVANLPRGVGKNAESYIRMNNKSELEEINNPPTPQGGQTEMFENPKPKKETKNGNPTRTSFEREFGELEGENGTEPPTIPDHLWRLASDRIDGDRIANEWGQFAQYHAAKRSLWVSGKGWKLAWNKWVNNALQRQSTYQSGQNSRPGKFATLCRNTVADGVERERMASREAPSWVQGRDTGGDGGDLSDMGGKRREAP